MKQLLTFDDPIYMRRLAKELRNLVDGFYWDGKRWTQAYCEKKPYENKAILWIGRETGRDYPEFTDEVMSFDTAENLIISDAYGKTIVASREK
jgi:hypothetical protein